MDRLEEIRERAIWDSGEYTLFLCDEISHLAAELKRYREAEEQGRLVMLPCKVGDCFYFVSVDPEIIERKAYRFLIRENGSVEITSDVMSCGWKLGKNCYLTREEAEAALAAQKEEG